MVNIILDGIYCKKCNNLHPTLMWHEKYNSYLLDREEKWRKAIKRFECYYDVEPKYEDKLSILGLKEEPTEGRCILCNNNTFFKSINKDEYVCSDECLYNLEHKNT